MNKPADPNSLKKSAADIGIELAVPKNIADCRGYRIEAPSRIGGFKPSRFFKCGAFSYIHDGYGHSVEVGRYCSIGKNLTVLQPNHTLETATTSPFLYSNFLNINNNLKWLGCELPHSTHFVDKPANKTDGKNIIGNDVWIGANVTILNGIHIADGAVIGAGSIVTKHVEPYSIVAGNPARHLRYRLEKHQIEKLLKLKWWDYTLTKELKMSMLSIANFIEVFIREQRSGSLAVFTPKTIEKG